MEPSTYRDPARARSIASIESLGDVSGSLAGAGLVLAGGDVRALARHLLTLSTARRRHDALARFFGSDAVIEAPGAWTSTDGRRRVRAVEGDRLVRFEEIDPSSGETLSSVRGPSPLAPVAAAAAHVIDRRMALVHGRAREPRCFTGIPFALGGRPTAQADACAVLLELRRDGARIDRIDVRGDVAGDTWHPDAASALAQLTLEYGDRLGAWRAGRALAPAGDGSRTEWAGYTRARIAL